MDRGEGLINKVLSRLCHPSMVAICINWVVTVLGIVGSILMVVCNYYGVWAYLVYVVSALSLAYTVYTIVRFAPSIKAKVLASVKRNRVAKEFLENYTYKTIVSGTVSLLINLGFVAFNVVFGLLTKSMWYWVSGIYYLALTSLKGGLFVAERRLRVEPDREASISSWRNYRTCGIALLLIDVAMAGVITMIMLQHSPTVYTEIVAITLAVYTCYKITFSIINYVKAKANDNPQIRSYRVIGLAEASLSVVSLQMALVSTFSDGDTDMTVLNAIVGFVVCAFSITIAILMIIKANKMISQQKNKN